MIVIAPLILLGFSLLLANTGTNPTQLSTADRRFLQLAWSKLWRVFIMAPPTILVEAYLLVVAGLVGRNYWGAYVVVYLGWLAGFGPLYFPTTPLGRASRRLAVAIVLIGTAVWLLGWAGELSNPGWQF